MRTRNLKNYPNIYRCMQLRLRMRMVVLWLGSFLLLAMILLTVLLTVTRDNENGSKGLLLICVPSVIAWAIFLWTLMNIYRNLKEEQVAQADQEIEEWETIHYESLSSYVTPNFLLMMEGVRLTVVPLCDIGRAEIHQINIRYASPMPYIKISRMQGKNIVYRLGRRPLNCQRDAKYLVGLLNSKRNV